MDPAALRAYAEIAQRAQGLAGSGGPQETNGAELVDGAQFTGLLQDAVGNVQEAVKTAEDLTVKAATGEAELVDVVTAMAAAEVQLESVIAVRDQVIRAYKEILQMPI